MRARFFNSVIIDTTVSSSRMPLFSFSRNRLQATPLLSLVRKRERERNTRDSARRNFKVPLKHKEGISHGRMKPRRPTISSSWKFFADVTSHLVNLIILRLKYYFLCLFSTRWIWFLNKKYIFLSQVYIIYTHIIYFFFYLIYTHLIHFFLRQQ